MRRSDLNDALSTALVEFMQSRGNQEMANQLHELFQGGPVGRASPAAEVLWRRAKHLTALAELASIMSNSAVILEGVDNDRHCDL